MNNDKLLNIIESCHINFLIGSGASRNFLDTLWNIENLLTELDKEEKKNDKWFRILDTSIKYTYFTKCMRGNLKLVNEDFELTKEKEEDFKLTSLNYEYFLKSLQTILLKRKTNLLTKEVNLFTTNMDVFFDVLLDRMGLEFNDGFNGKFESIYNTNNYNKLTYRRSSQYSFVSELPLFNLFKIHGSLLWDKSCSDRIKYDSKLTALNELNEILFEDTEIISLIDEQGKAKTYNSLKKEAKKMTNMLDDFDKHDAFYNIYERLIMINPTKEKFENTTLRLEYYEQMRMFSNILEKENSVLFVTGFSFADEHIKEIVNRALNTNPTLLVIVFNYSEGTKKDIDIKFSNLKYKNLYNEFTKFTFEKLTNEILVKIASKVDNNFEKLLSSKVENTELVNGDLK